MRYLEYEVKSSGEEKMLGLLGESHVYSKDECFRVAKLVRKYDSIGVEGEETNSLILKMTALFFIPHLISLERGTKRSRIYPDARSIAEANGAEVFILEPDESESIPLLKKFALLALSTIMVPFALKDYYDYKKDGDPFSFGTRAYEKRKQKRKRENNLDLFIIHRY